MKYAVNLLGAFIVGFCSFLLLRAYFRVRKRFLLWSGLCFAGLAVSNVLVFIDLSVFPEVNLYTCRLAVAAVSMLVLVYGLVLDSE